MQHRNSTAADIQTYLKIYDDLLGPAGRKVPDDFLLGTSTSSYQIEGGAHEDGRRDSVWDTFCRVPGRIANEASGDIAADHYHRVNEDLDLMAGLHMQAYRFSVSWSRVLPTGEGKVNQSGLDFYSRLVDGLLERGITPVLTLYHWDLPQDLQDRYGGWTARQTAYAFAHYAEVMGAALGDRVAMWSTHNEPWNSSYTAYGSGEFAPGGRSHENALKAVHHLNLAHGLGVQALRGSATHPDLQVSTVLNIFRIEPDRPEDLEAAQLVETVANRAFTDPVLLGRYPNELFQETSWVTDWAFVQPGDLEICHQKLDFLGINYYEIMHVRRADVSTGTGQPGGTMFPGAERVQFTQAERAPRTAMGWGVEPDGLEEHLVRLSQLYDGLPLIVMENGAAFADEVATRDGQPFIIDHERAQYLADHLEATLRARRRGAQVKGYFVWSLLDNFEWALGYGPKFGIVRVQDKTLDRIPKLSAAWFAKLNQDRAIPTLRTATAG
ncbi:GH1 family beta-glucosidase [Actinomyces urogenitalis]|uniref:GH1 family beta-glucosidase n=1 Tax=Actinomyces urogenitalis TaxID=103621 RepID=UPI00242AD87B|nr:GH1 family beta-glucosidase [Actinomyces urogenitalis]MCI7457677.1 GH1 family beta-glucosidase [Actinomyces urogenitalis]